MFHRSWTNCRYLAFGSTHLVLIIFDPFHPFSCTSVSEIYLSGLGLSFGSIIFVHVAYLSSFHLISISLVIRSVLLSSSFSFCVHTSSLAFCRPFCFSRAPFPSSHSSRTTPSTLGPFLHCVFHDKL